MPSNPLRTIQTSSPPIPDEMLVQGVVTARESAEFLGISRTTLWDLMDQGDLVWLRLRGRRMVPRRALVDYLSGLANPDHIECED